LVWLSWRLCDRLVGISAIAVQVGSALYQLGPGGPFDHFMSAHPFDILSVAVWYSAGSWLTRFIRNLWAAAGLCYGLSTAALASLLAASASWQAALTGTLIAGTVATVIVAILVRLFSGSGDDGPPPPTRHLHTRGALALLVAVVWVSVFFEYMQGSHRELPSSVLFVATICTVVVSRLMQMYGVGRASVTLAAMNSAQSRSSGTGPTPRPA